MNHSDYLKLAVQEALKNNGQSGDQCGAVMVKHDQVLAVSSNISQAANNPIATAEMECIRLAGRRNDQPDLVLYSTRYPDMLLAGTMVQFSIGALVIGLPEKSSPATSLLKSKGIRVTFFPEEACLKLNENIN